MFTVLILYLSFYLSPFMYMVFCLWVFLCTSCVLWSLCQKRLLDLLEL